METSPSPATQLIGMVQAHWITDAVCTAAELGVADVLARGPVPTGA